MDTSNWPPITYRFGIHPHSKLEHRIFPVTYAAARIIFKNAGKPARIEFRPHDLRLHAATYASGSEVPIEVVSKVILRHSNLSTTQRYLGKISDSEATRLAKRTVCKCP
jgi:integrase